MSWLAPANQQPRRRPTTGSPPSRPPKLSPRLHPPSSVRRIITAEDNANAELSLWEGRPVSSPAPLPLQARQRVSFLREDDTVSRRRGQRKGWLRPEHGSWLLTYRVYNRSEERRVGKECRSRWS